MTPAEFRDIPEELSEEMRNGYDILRNLDVADVNILKSLMGLGTPGVVGVQTLENFVVFCSGLGIRLTKTAVIAFKNDHHLGNTGAQLGIVGEQTAAVYYQTLLALHDRSVNGAACSFPFAQAPAAPWTTGARRYASNRNSGARAHAGCDLYFPAGTKIHAISDGVVTRGPYAFYSGTYALEVDHGDFLARYGEIQAGAPVHAGMQVTRGQVIAKVGHLVGIQVPSDMLHLELYEKTHQGPLTVGASVSKKRPDGVPFLRRLDLIDPTDLLNEWQHHLP